MDRTTLILLAAAGSAAIFLESPFAREALALALVFAGFALLSHAANAFLGAGHPPHHGERALLLSGRTAGTIAMASAALALVFLWRDLDPNGLIAAAALQALN